MVDWWNSYMPTLTGSYVPVNVMTPIIDSGYLNSAYAQSDGIHPNVSGYAAIGEYISSKGYAA